MDSLIHHEEAWWCEVEDSYYQVRWEIGGISSLHVERALSRSMTRTSGVMKAAAKAEPPMNKAQTSNNGQAPEHNAA